MPASTFRREPVSFVQRDSRLSPSSQSAWDAHSGRFVLDVPRGEARTSVADGFRLDPVEVFGRCAPLVLEIGSGSGDAVVEAAVRHPGWDFLAVEVYRPGVAQTLTRLGASGATNVRLVQANAVDVLRTALEGVQLQEVWTFFPDPWPKAKHHKRRLVTPATAALVAGRLAPGWAVAPGHRLAGLRRADAAGGGGVPAAVQPVRRVRAALRGAAGDPVRTQGGCRRAADRRPDVRAPYRLSAVPTSAVPVAAGHNPVARRAPPWGRMSAMAHVLSVNRVHTLLPQGPKGGETAIDKRPVEGPCRGRTAWASPATGRWTSSTTAGRCRRSTPTPARTLDWWARELGREIPPGIFGENLTTAGIDVGGARQGEQWRLGEPETPTTWSCRSRTPASRARPSRRAGRAALGQAVHRPRRARRLPQRREGRGGARGRRDRGGAGARAAKTIRELFAEVMRRA